MTVFVVGPNHSGTSLMLAMLDAHSAFTAIRYESRCFLDCRASLRADLFRHWDRVYGRWVEKTPKHLFRLPAIFAERPDARVIAMRRNPLDLVASTMIRMLERPKQKRFEALEKATAQVVASYRELGRAVRNPGVAHVQYEALVQKPETVLHPLCDFLGVSFDPGMLHFDEVSHGNWFPSDGLSAREVKAHRLRRKQISKKLYTVSVGRHRRNLSVDEIEYVRKAILNSGEEGLYPWV